jgi:hypothetical protein
VNYTEAFAKYGAKLANPQWSVSALGADGNVVACFWQNHLRQGVEKATLEYKDTLSSWLGNVPGRNEFAAHLLAAKDQGLLLRLVIAHPASEADARLVGKVADESSINKTFSVREDIVGHLQHFDGDEVHVVFRRTAGAVA